MESKKMRYARAVYGIYVLTVFANAKIKFDARDNIMSIYIQHTQKIMTRLCARVYTLCTFL